MVDEPTHEQTAVTVRHILPAGQRRYCQMKPSTKDQVKGKAQSVRGALKEQVGQLRNDPDLVDEGTVEKIGGQARQVLGKIEKAAGA